MDSHSARSAVELMAVTLKFDGLTDGTEGRIGVILELVFG